MRERRIPREKTGFAYLKTKDVLVFALSVSLKISEIRTDAGEINIAQIFSFI